MTELVDKSLALVESSKRVEVNIGSLRSKTIGLSLLLLGVAEYQAKRVNHLLKVTEKIEEDIFNIDIIEHLSPEEKIERYKLAMDVSAKSVTYIKDINNSTNWDDIETRLQLLDRTILDEAAGDKTVESADLAEAARNLLRELGSTR